MSEDNFHCKVCFEDYDDKKRRPKILGNCGHTFCLECVSGFFRAAPNPECPFCRKRVGTSLNELKDNYELIELLGTKVDKSPKFFCERCSTVASRHCTEHHSIRSLVSIAVEKISTSKENLEKKLNEERALLKEVHSALKSTLQAVQETVVARLECELDLCQERMEYLNHLPQDFEIAQKTVTRDGDFNLLSVFDLFDNKDECTFLNNAIEAQAKAFQYRLALHSTGKENSFSLGKSGEDQVLAYLISMLSPHQIQSMNGLNNGTVAKTTWMLSPWLTKWGKTQKDVHSNTCDGSSLDPLSDNESVTEPEGSREIYVGGIINQYASNKALMDIFSPYGTVTNIVMKQARSKGKLPVYAFIEFEDERTASSVLKNKGLFHHKYGLQVKPRITGKKQQSLQPHQRKNSTALQNSQQTQILSDSLGEEQDLAQRMLFIQNVPVDFPEHRISEILSKYGPVQDVRKQRKTEPGGVTRAFAFVTFVHKYSAQTALREPVKRIFWAGVALEYRAYHPRPNDSSETRNAEDSTSTPNANTSSSSSATKPATCSSSTVTKSTISNSPSATTQPTTSTTSTTRPTTSSNSLSTGIRPLMSISSTTPTVIRSQTFANSSTAVTSPSISASHVTNVTRPSRPPIPAKSSVRPPIPAKTSTRPAYLDVPMPRFPANSSSTSVVPPASANSSSAVTRPTPPSNTSSVLIRPILSTSSASTVNRPSNSNNSSATSRPVASNSHGLNSPPQPRNESAFNSFAYNPSAPPMPHGKKEKDCIIQ